MAYNILIVDDSRTARMFISKALEIAGLDIGTIFEAGDGQQALDILHRNWIDIVLADINMPVMTGIEMVQQMNKDGLMKTVPVVIVSTERSATRINELKDDGVQEYVNKPFTPETIKDVVERILNKPADKDAPPSSPAQP